MIAKCLPPLFLFCSFTLNYIHKKKNVPLFRADDGVQPLD